MRWTSRSWLWGLLTVLLFGLVLMHHTPSHSAHDAGVASAPAAADITSMSDSPASNCPCPATDHNDSLPGGSSGPGSTALLHLCLAVLAALGSILTAGLALRGTIAHIGRNIGLMGRWTGLEYLRPPVPVPRRLAALCVLRL